MTDKEITKALECCVTDDYDESCIKCPMLKHKPCDYTLHKNALDLINQQQAEIEKLNVELVGMRGACNSYKMHYDNAKAEIERLNNNLSAMAITLSNSAKETRNEAIKEFAERLKEFMHTKFKYLDAYEFEYVTENDIDNLVKEMVGDNK